MKDVVEVSNEIYFAVRELPSPRDAAKALAIAQARIIHEGGADNETEARKMMKDTAENVIDMWSQIAGIPLKQ